MTADPAFVSGGFGPATRQAVLELADRIDAGRSLHPRDAAAVGALPGWGLVWRYHRAGHRYAVACAVGPAEGHVRVGGWQGGKAAAVELRRWGWSREARAWLADEVSR